MEILQTVRYLILLDLVTNTHTLLVLVSRLSLTQIISQGKNQIVPLILAKLVVTDALLKSHDRL